MSGFAPSNLLRIRRLLATSDRVQIHQASQRTSERLARARARAGLPADAFCGPLPMLKAQRRDRLVDAVMVRWPAAVRLSIGDRLDRAIALRCANEGQPLPPGTNL